MLLQLLLFILGFILLAATAAITAIRAFKTKEKHYRIVLILYVVLIIISTKLISLVMFE